jgi:hypothetical protein
MFSNVKKISRWIVFLIVALPNLGYGQTESLDDLYKKALKKAGI